jgi:hypothetical protein
MADHQKPEPVHYGYLMRRLMECLPPVKEREEFICSTINALAAHAGTFFFKEDLEAGVIKFDGTITFDQLAAYCKVARATAKWRLYQLRDRWNLVEWRRTKFGLSYQVRYTKANPLAEANRLANPTKANGLAETTRTDYAQAAHEPLTSYARATHTPQFQPPSANGNSPSANDTPTGSPILSSLSKEKEKNRKESSSLSLNSKDTGETPVPPKEQQPSQKPNPNPAPKPRPRTEFIPPVQTNGNGHNRTAAAPEFAPICPTHGAWGNEFTCDTCAAREEYVEALTKWEKTR